MKSVFLIVALLCFEASAQINVTNYGAKGDYTAAVFNTVSNNLSVEGVGTSFTVSDTNKLVMIFQAGTFQTISNQALLVRITSVSDATHIMVSSPPLATMNNLPGAYWTDDCAAFSNAVRAAAIPTDTILIPEGNYGLVLSNIDDYYGSGITLWRGGLTFQGQGTAILTGQGGWRNNSAGQGRRKSIVSMWSPVTNTYPVVFTNLTFDGGTLQGYDGGGNNGPSPQTGEGWDVSHHAFQLSSTNSPLSFPTNITFAGCVFHGWRGEVLISTTTTPNTFLRANNNFFYDCNATAFNFSQPHDWTGNTFSNIVEVEEFYRSYATNGSQFVGNKILNCDQGVALNGGYFQNPIYSISNNVSIAASGSYRFVSTTPACEVVISSNWLSGGVAGVAYSIAGYQDENGIANSNILQTFNYMTNVFIPASWGGGGGAVYHVLVADNILVNCGVSSGNGYGGDFVFSNNIVSGFIGSVGGMLDGSSLQSVYFTDVGNSYVGRTWGNFTDAGQTNFISYAYGSKAVMSPTTLTGASNKLWVASNSDKAKIPMAAQITVSNATAYSEPLWLNTNYTAKISLNSHSSTNLYFDAIALQWNVTSDLPPGPSPTSLNVEGGFWR